MAMPQNPDEMLAMMRALQEISGGMDPSAIPTELQVGGTR